MQSGFLFSQVDTSGSLLGDEPELIEHVIGSFKTSRVINLQSLEVTDPGVLDFKINHRFGTVNTGAYDAFGLDNAQVRIGADYGIVPNLAVTAGRSSVANMVDLGLKYRFMQQTTNNKRPLSMLAFLSAARTGGQIADYNSLGSRLSFAAQLIIGRKFNDAFSFQISPTLIRINPTVSSGSREFLATGLAFRQKITARTSLNVEWTPFIDLSTYSGSDPKPDVEYKQSLSVGFDIETGGHVFQIHFTNSAGMVDQFFIPRTTDRWLDGGFRFGFNISRVFTLVSPDKFR